MKKVRFNYGKLAAVIVAVAIALTQSVSASRLTNSAMAKAAFDQPDLSAEARTLDSFNVDFANYNKKGYELSKKSSLTSQEFDSLERTGNDLKRRVAELNDAVQSVIRKLKAADRWNTLDADLLARLTDAGDRSLVQRNGGVRRILEDAVSQLDSQAADEIVVPLSHLRPKIVARDNEFRFDDSTGQRVRMVAARYETPAVNPATPLAKRSFGCVLATVRWSTSLIVRGAGNVPGDLSSNMHCQCDGGSGCRPGDTSIMVW